MRHYQVGKYDKSSDAYLEDWTQLERLVPHASRADLVDLPETYMTAERAYLNFTECVIVADRDAGGTLRAEDVRLNFSEYELAENELIARSLRTSVYGLVSEKVLLELKGNSSPSMLDALFLMQLSLRNLCNAVLRSEHFRLFVGNDYYFLLSISNKLDVRDFMCSGLFIHEINDPLE